ncbi:SemiSWEET family sugar transporter [Ancylobacter sp. SL191]|uniref:SemiSWEET family sugar transporter n=1 Tax=Ancylobacter sp. SL191 TaxID=2995166 RepID=UPI0022706661|nr:SemiSWEET transporter [Ancylobacter sp. SL191]WAC25775.1 SemiSWEET transporter [Ancylobacter sp. SL191]
MAFSPLLTEAIGGLAALLTTLCWLPQALKILRTRETRDLSLIAYLAFAAGVALWLVYGLLIVSWPVIAANAVTLVLLLGILSLKLRYG